MDNNNEYAKKYQIQCPKCGQKQVPWAEELSDGWMECINENCKATINLEK